MLYSNPDSNYNPPECKINNADPIKYRNGRPFVRARSVRQRKSRDTSRTSSVQSSEEDKKNAVISSNMVEKNPCLEQQEQQNEKPKEIREVPEEIHGNNIETESSEEEDDEKNKGGVQWTEDDEKNLTDLGLLEMERNKRLESLIARRRARKMFSLQIRKTLLLNKEISLIQPPPPPPPPIAILKNKPFSSHGGGSASGEVSPTPGSAPPVLLPSHDPFDLPYDPFEEKPVLTGGSFHQEFIAPEPLDAVFCRHESFCLGKQDEHAGHRNTEVLDNCNQLEEKDIDKIIEEVESSSCQSPESNFKKIKADHCMTEEIQGLERGTVMVDDDDNPEENRNTGEVETKSMVVENPSYCRSSSTSSDEDDPPFIRVDKEAILKSLASPHPRSFSLNRDHTRNQMGHILNNYDAAMMDKVIRHRPTHSIASDMQVEVSEIGSPPQTIDGSFSSFDIGSPIEEEDINYGNESLWELSSQISVNDEDKSALKEIYRLHDEYTIKHGTSRCKQSKDSVELRDLVKNMEEQGVSGSFTRPDDSQISTPESSQTFIPGISDHSDVENAEKLTETGTVRHFDSDCDEILDEPSHPSTSSMEANSFPFSTEPNVTEYEIRQKETMEVPQNTSTSIISHFDMITDLQKPTEESDPSVSDEINNKSEDSVDLANFIEQFDPSNRLLVDTEEPSYPSTSSMEANFFTDSEVEEHEKRQNELMEVTQSTSTRVTNLDTTAYPQQPFEEYESSSLDEANNKSEDPQKQVDTKTESSIAIDEGQNVTMEDPKNASSSSTSLITKESNLSTLDNKDDKQQSPHKHEVN